MKKIPVFLAILFAKLTFSQITVINTGTSDNIYKILKFKDNYLIPGNKTFIGKCYGKCDTVYRLNLPQFPNPNYVFAVSRPDTSILYMTASSQNLNLTFWKSIDGGYSWLKKFDTASGAMYSGLTEFFDTQSGISLSVNQKSIITSNGFSTYTFGTWPSTYPYSVAVFGDSTIILGECDVYCGMLISHNRGKNWNYTGPKYGYGVNIVTDIEFLNNDTIFCITNVVNQVSSFSATFDGGVSFWTDHSFTGLNGYGPDDLFGGICAKKGNEVYVTGRAGNNGNYNGFGVILKTTDQGKTWAKFTTPFKQILYDMKFIDDTTALVAGSNGLLFKWNSKSALFTGINENKKNELAVTVYPNPTTGKLNMEIGENTRLLKVSASNLLGQIVYEIDGSKIKDELDISSLPKGIYFLKLSGQKAQKEIKVIRE